MSEFRSGKQTPGPALVSCQNSVWLKGDSAHSWSCSYGNPDDSYPATHTHTRTHGSLMLRKQADTFELKEL